MIERYVTGQLDREEAEAFERHLFDCDRCWEKVWRAVEVRSAFESSDAEAIGGRPHGRRWEPEPGSRKDEERSPAEAEARPSPTRWPGRRVLLPLAAAAGLVLAAIGLWQALPEGPGPESDVYRSSEGALEASAYTSGDVIVTSWRPLEEAERYRVRVYTGEGAVLYDRTTADTVLDVTSGELSPRPGDAELYWRVDALDALGRVVARSGLRSVAPPSPQPR